MFLSWWPLVTNYMCFKTTQWPDVTGFWKVTQSSDQRSLDRVTFVLVALIMKSHWLKRLDMWYIIVYFWYGPIKIKSILFDLFSQRRDIAVIRTLLHVSKSSRSGRCNADAMSIFPPRRWCYFLYESTKKNCECVWCVAGNAADSTMLLVT